MTPAELVLERLTNQGCNPTRNGAGWHARCPAHEDRKPSLTLSENDKSDALLHCHAGCTTEAVVAELKLKMSDLYARRNGDHGEERSRIEATYPYTDEAGEVLFEVVRRYPKGFYQRTPDGMGGWVYKLGNTRRVLYRLPAVIEAVRSGRPVFVVEGEKDVEALERAGEVATCNPQGAGKWSKVPDAPEILTGAHVYVVRDMDDPGLQHAVDVVRSLLGRAAAIGICEPAHGKDVAEHLGGGRGVDELFVVAEDGHEVEPAVPSIADWLAATPPPTADRDEAQADINEALDSWSPVDLGPVLAGDAESPTPTILRSKDKRLALFYPGCVNGLHGDSTSGKTWLMLAAMAQELDEGRTVLMVDAEANAAEIVARLRSLAVPADVITERFLYVTPLTPATDIVVAHLVDLIAERQVTLVGIDSAGEMFGLEGLDENKDTDVGPWFRRVPRTLAGAGPAVVLNDHATKAGDNPLHPSGSKRKRAAITGASYLVEAIKAPTRTEAGRLKLTTAKDRHGHHQRGRVVAHVDVTPYGDGGVTVTVWPASGDELDGLLLAAARAILRVLKAEDRAMSGNELRNHPKVKARTQLKLAALDLLVGKGCVKVERGAKNAWMHTFAMDLPEEEATP